MPKNRAPKGMRIEILKLLVEGNTIAGVGRILGCAKRTVTRVLIECGAVAQKLMDEKFVKLPCGTLQIDEMWSFVGCKHRISETGKFHPGAMWLWRAICPVSKLIPCWYLGDRSALSARAFMAELKTRVGIDVIITTDCLSSYPGAIKAHFEFAEHFRRRKFVGRDIPFGGPNTNHIERANLTMRRANARMARGTNAYSKTLENHKAAISLAMGYYNLCRANQGICGQTPAMAAGILDSPMRLADFVDASDATQQQAIDAQFEAAFAAMGRFEPAPMKTLDSVAA